MINISISRESNIKVNGKNVLANLILKSGEITQLVGPNGVGKSTLLQYLKHHQQQVLSNEYCQFLDQNRLTPLNQVSFEDIKNVLQNMRYEELPLFLEFEKFVVEYMHLPLNNLSGGQNQMIKICLSLYLSGNVFFFDEPFQFLDQKNQSRFLEVLKELKKLQKTILIIEHQLDLKGIVNHVCTVENDSNEGVI